MGRDASKDIQDRQKQNLKAFDDWVHAYGKMILPIPNRAVIYAGFPPAELAKAKATLSRTEGLKRMWQIIEEADRQLREITGQVSYDKLNDVLRRIKSPLPKLVEATGANAGDPKKFSDMLSCAEKLTDPRWALIDKGKFNYVWDTLSETYVRNSKGDVQIWEGVKANHRQVDISTTLIRAEIKALLERADLPDATRKAAAQIAVRYAKHHADQQIYAERLVDEAVKTLRAARKR